MSQPKSYWNEANAKAWEREMMKPKKLYIQKKHFDIGVWARLWVSEQPLPIDLKNEEFGEVEEMVSLQAYQKAVDALKYYADSPSGAFARETLYDLNELDAPGKGEG